MTIEENKAVVRRVFEAFEQQKLKALDELFAPDAIHRTSGPVPDAQGVEAMKEGARTYLSAFPDARFTPEGEIAEGEFVVTRFTWRGTHRGELFGIPPTGKSVEVPAIAVHRVVESKVTEVWECQDLLGLMQQLGVAPEIDSP